VAVPVDGTGTTTVEPVMVLPVPGVQKPPRRVGKRFWDHLWKEAQQEVRQH
jgi:hypothetical protein